MKVTPFTLKAVLIATACLAPVIFVLSGILLQSEFTEGRRLRAELNHSYETQLALENLLTLHLDLETAHRGFIITGDAQFLEPSRQREGQIERTFSELREVLEPDAPLRAGLDALRARSAAKRKFIAEGIALAQDGRLDEARELVATARGKQLMDGIRASIARMEAQESAALAQRIKAGERSRYRLRTIFLVGSAVLSLLLLAAAVLGLRMDRARRQAVERLRGSLARQDALFDNAPDGLILLDQSGRIEHLNSSAAKMFDYEPQALRNRHVTRLLSDAPSSGKVRNLLKVLRDGGEEASLPREMGGLRQDGSQFAAEVTVTAVPTDHLSDGCYMAVVRDITQRKQVEKMKNEFVSIASHELRTPLTSIAGSLGLLAGGAAGALPERAAKLVGIAHSNSMRLVRLVNDILDIEKLQAGMLRPTLRPIELGPVIEQTVQQNLGFAGEYGVRLEADPVPMDAVVSADEDRLVQVLTNLLSNAIKFSPTGEVVRVSVLHLGDMVRISVADRGPGIPEEFRDTIFQKFTQVDSSDTRQKGGTGLGLTIVSEIVALLHGQVSFDSEPGRGTTFHVDLPRSVEAIGGEAQERARDQPPGR